jgi:hypothetical protein
MSDYLTHLAARSLHLTAVIQPRLTSLFEPTRPTGMPAPGQPFTWESPDGVPTSDEAAFGVLAPPQPFASPPPRRPQASPPPPADLRVPPEVPHQPPGDVQTIPDLYAGQRPGQQPPQLTLAAPRPSETRPEWSPGPSMPGPAQPAAPQTPLPLLQPRPATAGADTIVRLEAAQVAAVSTVHRPEPARPTLTSVTARDDTDATTPRSVAETPRRPAVEPVSRHIVYERVASSAEQGPSVIPHREPSALHTVRPAAPTAIIVQHVTPHMKSAAPAPIGPTAPPEPAPTIQVTIGRIEVRATPPPATPPPRQRAAAPVMSLDAYLNRRGRGGDR